MTRFSAFRWMLAWLVTAFVSAFVFVQMSSADTIPRASRTAGVGVAEPAITGSYSGLYLGGGVGGAWADSELSASQPLGEGFENSASINGLSGRGLVGDVRVGVDWQVGNSPFVVGILGGYKFGGIDFDANVSTGGQNVASLDATITPTWYGGVRFGVVFPNKALLYTGYFYGQSELRIREGGKLTGLCDVSGVACSHDLNVHTIPVGIEFPLTNNLALSLEYTYSMHDTARIFDVEGTRVDLNPDTHAVMLRLNARLPGFGN